VSESRLAVIDCGSNSFRLVVFTYTDTWWKRTDEIHEAVRVGEGLEATGELQPEPMERALETLELYAHFCMATGIEDIRPVATSAIRDAANRDAFLALARERSGLEVEVLPGPAEARYGYLAAINSTTLEDGVVLDLGGGSMQLTRVLERAADDARSWPLGAVRMTERFFGANDGPAKKKHIKALREHIAHELESAPWLGDDGRLVAIGGTVRNLAAAAQLAAELPSYGIQGYRVTRAALGELIERFMALAPSERGSVPGIKASRGDLILAGALVVEGVMEAGGFEAFEATEAGLREGVFFERLYPDGLSSDVRRDAVRNLAAQYDTDFAHSEHVARLALELWDALKAAGLHEGDLDERELVWATGMLHDIGVAVDYDDHHKHSRYLILNAGLPGFSPRETALIGQAARYHRKGTPSLGEFSGLLDDEDLAELDRVTTAVRLAEQFERARDQSVHAADVLVHDGTVELHLQADGDTRIARWAAERQADLFRRAFSKDLSVS
jgi:exopolyphosphatase/guanosine-5'-triphosphate,3'-diphosphate pyrophosphatase